MLAFCHVFRSQIIVIYKMEKRVCMKDMNRAHVYSIRGNVAKLFGYEIV